jgi:hypothetical protein
MHGYKKKPLDTLLERTFNAWDLLGALPDLFLTLTAYGFPSTVCQGACSLYVLRQVDASIVATYFFVLHNISDEAMKTVKDMYRTRSPDLKVQVDSETNLGFKAEVFRKTRNEPIPIDFPDIVSDMHGRPFYILAPDNYVVEPAAFLMLLYCLGILSRYYPDVWMALIDNNTRFVEITDALLNVAFRKLPNLILNEMRDTLYLFSSGVTKSG